MNAAVRVAMLTIGTALLLVGVILSCTVMRSGNSAFMANSLPVTVGMAVVGGAFIYLPHRLQGR